ncbi:uncharacterized protein LOC141607463 [Silene latifolia]|uniref:uncharacterized protein LOC141607463 n=1 Tax=Silene latifolia TaxID=37657 RepID=UPI003D7712EE
MSTGEFAYLNAISLKHWSRHPFSSQTKSELLLNNCCESFNSVLEQCRDKPILTLFEWIRRYVMNRMFTRFQILDKYKSSIMNTTTKSLYKVAKQSRNYQILQSGLMEIEVTSKADVNDRWVVNLDKMTCEYFQWELTDIPCAHAYGCLVKKRIDPVTYVHKAYSRDLYRLNYSTHIQPLLGTNN